MNDWHKNFESLKLSKRSWSALRAWEKAGSEGLDEEGVMSYTRLLKVLRLLYASLQSLDPDIFSINNWGGIEGYFDDIKRAAENFESNRQRMWVQHANDQVDLILRVYQPIDGSKTPEFVNKLNDAAEVYYKKTMALFQSFKEKHNELIEENRSLNELVNGLKGKIIECENVIQDQKARLDHAITEQLSQFSTAQERRSEDFSKINQRNNDTFANLQKDFKSHFEKALHSYEKGAETIVGGIKQVSGEHLSFLAQREEEVDKIFGAIGATALAGNFKNTADNEAKSANIWRRVSLLFMAVMIGVAVYAFYYSIGHETDWRVFAFRLGTVIVLAVPAIYAANESTKHRELEKINRRFHLELASIDAYLVLLPDDQKNQIKGKLAEKFFGATTSGEKHNEVSSKDLFTTLSKAVDNLTKGK